MLSTSLQGWPPKVASPKGPGLYINQLFASPLCENHRERQLRPAAARASASEGTSFQFCKTALKPKLQAPTY